MSDSESLEERIAALEDRFDAWRSHTVKPRFQDLEDRSDDARAERAELRATIEDLQNDVANLHFAVEGLKGLGEGEETTPAARVRDLRATMIERAQTLTDRAGVQLWWREVQDLFSDLNHGKVSKPDCYKAMEEAADADGFELTTKNNANDNQVKAIRLKTAALPGGAASRNPTTGEGTSAGQNGGETAAEPNLD